MNKVIYESPVKVLTKRAYYQYGVQAANEAREKMSDKEIAVMYYNLEDKIVVYILKDDGDTGFSGIDLCLVDNDTEIDKVINDMRDKYVEWLEFRLNI